jgi:hypothetical protein
MKLEKGRIYRLKADRVFGWRPAESGGWLWVCEDPNIRYGLRQGDPRFRSVATGETIWLIMPELWLEEAEDEAGER